jgi:hypothetical protein
LRGTRKGLRNGRCLLRNEEEDAVHILLKFPQTRRLRKHLLSRKWQTINEEIACKKMINFSNTLEIRNIGSVFGHPWVLINNVKKDRNMSC